MNLDNSAILDTVLNKAVEKLLDWQFSSTGHPLEHCNAEVQAHIQKASTLATQKRYDEAIQELTFASEKEPRYVGPRVRTMKYLIKDNKPLLGMLIGGGVLVLEKDPKTKGQVWDMASGVALGVFEQSKLTQYIDEALTFANNATRLDPEHILSNWNRIEILLVYARQMEKEKKTEESDKYYDLAKRALERLIDIAKRNKEVAHRYWSRLVADANRIFPDDEWWKIKLSDMSEMTEGLEDVSDDMPAPINSPDATASVLKTVNWKHSLVAATLALLVWSDLFTMIPHNILQWDTQQPNTEVVLAQGDQTRIAEEANEESSQAEHLARLERPDMDLARLDRDDKDLAVTREILDSYYQVARIERDDGDLA